MESNKETKDKNTSTEEIGSESETPKDQVVSPISAAEGFDEDQIVEAILVKEDSDEYSDTVVVDMTGRDYEDLLMDGIDDDLDIVIIDDTEEEEAIDLIEDGEAVHMDNFFLDEEQVIDEQFDDLLGA